VAELAAHLAEDLLLEGGGIRRQHAALGGGDLRGRRDGDRHVHFHDLSLVDDLCLLDDLGLVNHLGDHLRRARRQQRCAAGNAGEPDKLSP
jgi:hypothetical protein